MLSRFGPHLRGFGLGIYSNLWVLSSYDYSTTKPIKHAYSIYAPHESTKKKRLIINSLTTMVDTIDPKILFS